MTNFKNKLDGVKKVENAGLVWFLYVIVPALGFVATYILADRAEKKGDAK